MESDPGVSRAGERGEGAEGEHCAADVDEGAFGNACGGGELFPGDVMFTEAIIS